MTSLLEFVEAASQRADAIFRRTGSIKPMFHAVERSGHEFVFGAYMDDKDTMCILARAAFKIHDVVRYLFMDEAWTVVACAADRAANEKLIAEAIRVGTRNHPMRKEVVMISAEDAAEGQLVAMRPIIRPARRPAYLGPLEIETAFNQSEGRFVGMLPRGKERLQ